MGTFGVTACILHCTVPSRLCLNLIIPYMHYFCSVYILRISYLCAFHVFQCAVVRLRGVVYIYNIYGYAECFHVLYVSYRLIR